MGTESFPTPCVNSYKDLLQNNPQRLLDWVKSGTLEPADLTFAVEILGGWACDRAVRALLDLLKHPDAAVREGVVYGLRGHPEVDVVIALSEALGTETSPGVREVMEELLKIHTEILAP